MRDKGVNIQNESDAAVTQNGCGGNAGHVAVIGFETFDHHLPLIDDGIHHQGTAGA